MKYLIPGGAGFIGSHLVERLLSKGHEVVVIDRLSQGKLSNLPVDKNLYIYKKDILGDIGYIFKGVDVVFHLAALTRPRESMGNSSETFDVNVHGTYKILEHCKNRGVKRVVFASSAATYGFKSSLPIAECFKQRPESPYAMSKVLGEKLCKFYSETTNMEINWVRPFNVFGTRQNPDGRYGAAVPKFIDALKKDKIPFITGDGEQFRDFIHVDDVVDLLILVSESEIEKFYGEEFNVGSGVSTTINKLYKIISKIMDKDIKPDYVEKVEEPDTQANIRKARMLLNWKPKLSLEEGLKKII